jgi:hypothetical protein
MNNKVFFLIILITGLLASSLYAQGDLLITPNRLVFKPNKVKEIINLVNTGSTKETYLVSFVERSMNENGSFTIVTKPEPGQNFAQPHLRIYPRTITLKPGEGQVVMLQRRRNSKNQTGEYRSHLYFRSTTDYSALGKTINDTVTGVSVKLRPIFGMTIPVIFHSGKVSATATLSELKLESEKNINKINFTLNRVGNKSLYGDFTVEYFPVKGKSTTIAKINGVAIYTTIKKRFMSLNLPTTPLINFKEGTIKVIYKTRPGEQKQSIFAESILNL